MMLHDCRSEWLNQRNNLAVQTDNVYFVDRDPKHFQRVLNYLRDGSCVLPSSVEDRKELLVEARHYQVRSGCYFSSVAGE
jgi:hypothetical protein